jgi:hypothetical protein
MREELTAVATSLDAAVLIFAVLALHTRDDQTSQVAVQLLFQRIFLNTFCTRTVSLAMFDLLDG